jgi:hypothetical protein
LKHLYFLLDLRDSILSPGGDGNTATARRVLPVLVGFTGSRSARQLQLGAFAISIRDLRSATQASRAFHLRKIIRERVLNSNVAWRADTFQRLPPSQPTHSIGSATCPQELFSSVPGVPSITDRDSFDGIKPFDGNLEITPTSRRSWLWGFQRLMCNQTDTECLNFVGGTGRNLIFCQTDMRVFMQTFMGTDNRLIILLLFHRRVVCGGGGGTTPRSTCAGSFLRYFLNPILSFALKVEREEPDNKAP